MEELVVRVKRLEGLLGNSSASSDSLQKRITGLYDSLRTTLASVPSFSAFFVEYETKGNMLDTKGFEKKRNNLPADTKMELLLSAEKRLQAHVTLLKKLNEMVHYINHEPLQELLAFDATNSKQWQAEKIQIVSLIAARLEEIQQQYNTITDLLSIRFLQIDKQLSEWESRR